MGIKYRDRRIIYNLYRGQKAVIQVEGYEEEADIQKGVRQGCSLSSLLFSLYVEQAVKKVKEKFGKRIKIQEETYKMLLLRVMLSF